MPYQKYDIAMIFEALPSFERFSFFRHAHPIFTLNGISNTAPPIMYLARDSSLNSVQDATWWRSVIRREVAAERHDFSHPTTSTPNPKQRPNSARAPHPSSGWLDNTPEWQAYLKTVTAAGKVGAADTAAAGSKAGSSHAASHAGSHAASSRS